MKALLLAFVVAACADVTETDLDLAASDAVSDEDKADGSAAWDLAPTLHAGARVFDATQMAGRRVHPLWLAGTPGSPLAFSVEVTAAQGYDVRIAVLGPLKNGARAVLAADGYASRKTTAGVSLSTTV